MHAAESGPTAIAPAPNQSSSSQPGAGARSIFARHDRADTDVLALLEATFDAVVIMDDRGRISAFNAPPKRCSAIAPPTPLGRNVSMLMTSADRAAHDDHLRRYLAGGEPRVLGRGRDVRVRHRDGSEFSVFLSVGRIPEHRAAAVRRLPARHVAAPQGAGHARARNARSIACTWTWRR